MNPIRGEQRSLWLKEEAKKLGFSFCGISRARYLDEEAPRLEQWLKEGHHGQMGYMANHFDLRLDPRLLVPGAKTVVSLLYNYHNPDFNPNPDAPKIASYAFGRDYHKVVRKKLDMLMRTLQEKVGAVEGRAFVDSAPVMERQWAAQAGLGWTGKNTLLINKGHGSYFFLAELIIDLELEPDTPVKDYCGSCTACIDACPTEAITPYKVAAEKCISYLTIELKENIPDPFKGKMENWAFGCDICQQVCPWNRFSQRHNEPDFTPRFPILHWSRRQWEEISAEDFEKHFTGSPLKRAGREKLLSTLTNPE